MNKSSIVAALYAFICQRSGIEFGNYQSGDWKQSRKCFMGDYRPILRHGKQARQLLRAIELRSSITAQNIIDATRAFSGRLQLIERDGKVAVDYTTGQYFPTEYRKAACAVLAQCLWDYFRSNMPEPTVKQYGSSEDLPMRTECLYDGLSAGAYIRKTARREFGRSIVSTWFN